MLSASMLTERVRQLAPEAIAFAVIGTGSTLLYLAITYAAMGIGPVKASVLATAVTTTLAYVANRYWTYRNHTRTALRRNYTLFFGFNLIGMVIQSGMTALGKYGFRLSEHDDKLRLLGMTTIGIVIGTIFRFWAYRTFVFLKPPVNRHEGNTTDMDATACSPRPARPTDSGVPLAATVGRSYAPPRSRRGINHPAHPLDRYRKPRYCTGIEHGIWRQP